MNTCTLTRKKGCPKFRVKIFHGVKEIKIVLSVGLSVGLSVCLSVVCKGLKTKEGFLNKNILCFIMA